MTDDSPLRLIEVRRALLTGEAKQVRLAAGLSLAEMAAGVDVDQSTLHRWETGRRVPRGPVALRYGALLDVVRQTIAAAAPPHSEAV